MAIAGSRRDEFPEKVIQVLQKRAGNHCSNPDCRRLTSGPNRDNAKATSIGVAAHITAAARGGPRYDESLTSEQRRSIRNGIWLCQSCARLIDVDTSEYPDEKLCAWKTEAEDWARTKQRGGKPDSPESRDKDKHGWPCPWCGTIVGFDKYVCLGCGADVVYGSTEAERSEAASAGLWGGAFLGLLVFVLLPEGLNSYFGWQLPIGLSLGFIALLITGAMAVACGFFAAHLDDAEHRKHPPRFFR